MSPQFFANGALLASCFVLEFFLVFGQTPAIAQQNVGKDLSEETYAVLDSLTIPSSNRSNARIPRHHQLIEAQLDKLVQMAEQCEAQGDYHFAFQYLKEHEHLQDSLFMLQKKEVQWRLQLRRKIAQKGAEHHWLSRQRSLLVIGIVLLSVLATLLLLLNHQKQRHSDELEAVAQKRTRLLSKKNRQLEQLHEEFQQFVYIISHDLQQPITTISSYVSLLRRKHKYQFEEAGIQYLDKISMTTHWGSILLKELLHYSRIGRNTQWVIIDLNEVISEVLTEFIKEISASNATIYVIHKLPSIRGDKTDFKHLIRCVIYNSLTVCESTTSPSIKISITEDEKTWCMEVENNCTAIPIHVPPKSDILSHHVREKEPGQPSGYLSTKHSFATCKKIIHMHGGTLKVQSHPQQGKKFVIRIPKHPVSIRPPMSSSQATIVT